MPSTFFGLNIAVSGMSTYNAGLTTTAHNISNVKTQGYSKQTVVQSAKEAISLRTSYGMLGAGVNASEVISSRDDYYDAKYRINNANVGKYSIESFYLSTIEDYIYPKDKDAGSINNSLDSFFSSLKYLTTSSLDTTIRAEVAGYADTFAYYVRDVGTKLQNLQNDVNTEIETTVKQINAYAAQIASLNKQINTLEVYGDRANDLRDQRAVILDELSKLADITVTEKAPADGNGTNQFIVNLGGGVLVDTTTYNTIKVTSDDLHTYQNDASHMYRLSWSYGQNFDSYSTTLGGKLQGLFELRDGNNGENFKATITNVKKSDVAHGNRSTFTVQSDEHSSVNASNLAKLDLPATNGVLTVGKLQYAYDSFTTTVAADGTYTYTFVLKEELSDGQVDRIEQIIASTDTDPAKKQATAGTSIAFRGIPYYMAQLNEFIRTFSANFNMVQNQGYDYNGNLGQDLFVATDITSGKEYTMHEFLFDEADGFYYYDGTKVFDTTKKQAYEQKGYTFESLGNQYYTLKDSDGNAVEKVYIPQQDDQVFTFQSVNAEGSQISYYNLSVLNYYASTAIVEDGRLLACSAENTEGVAGWEEAKNLAKMIALQTDNTMFKQGDPGSFMNVLSTAVLGVDSARVTDASENATNILNAVEHRRTSISGVDEDEEGQNLVIYQNLLNYQYRVLSVMNEVLDKLINETAI